MLARPAAIGSAPATTNPAEPNGSVDISVPERTYPSERLSHPVRRALFMMVATAVLAFLIVGSATVFIARSIARETALSEAERSTRSMADVVFIPVLPAAIRSDPAALESLGRVVAARKANGSIVRVKVWTREGKIVYSDAAPLIGRQFASHADVQAVFDSQQPKSEVTTLDADENLAEAGLYKRLVAVYAPITLKDGRKLVLEIYSTDARLVMAEKNLTGKLVPLSLGSLVVLLIAQLPISMWLVRRVVAAQQERGRLLRNTLIASARERRTIARDLHDGVVQDLAGVGYAVGALTQSLSETASASTAHTLERVSSTMQHAISRLRTLMVDIYPPDLSSDGLHTAIEDLAAPLREGGIVVDVAVELAAEPAPEVAATLYRCVREGLANVVKHAQAQHATIELIGDTKTVVLRLQDDGEGVSGTDINRAADGHLGLQLLRDAATDLGGEMDVSATPGAGTTLKMCLPVAGLPST